MITRETEYSDIYICEGCNSEHVFNNLIFECKVCGIDTCMNCGYIYNDKTDVCLKHLRILEAMNVK